MRSLAGSLDASHRRSAGMRRGRLAVVAVATLMLIGVTFPAVGATTVPVLWTAGGLSAGIDSAGQAARIAVDPSGNVAVVSGPAEGSLLAVTSYTPDGALRWQRTISPSVGTFTGDWVAAAPNGDFVAVGHNITSRGAPIAITIVRYASDGTLLWRVDPAGMGPSVGRLLIDAAGDAYLAFNSVGDGQDIRLHKYDASGVLLWAAVIGTGFFANDFATSLALSPDEADVVVTGNTRGGATWITAAYDAATGTRKWLVTAAEGITALDVVVDGGAVYVTGQGNVGIAGFLTVVAYDRATGARLWRTDKKPADAAAASGLRMAFAPDGSLVVTGHASRGFLDWYTVAFETSGAVRWEAVRDGGLNTDEIPRGLLMMSDGTTVVTGRGGPNLPGGFIQGVTAAYGPDGTLLWEAFARMETVWATALPNAQDVCATGGYDALITCWRTSGFVRADMSFNPSTGTAPLSVTFDGSGSTTPSGTVTSWAWSFGDGSFGTGPVTTHVYSTPGTYTASLRVTDSSGASGSATGSIVVNPPPPAAPSGLTASLSGYLVILTWQDNSSNETFFYIERCEGAGCTNFASFASQWADYPSYTDYSAITGRTYRYRVRAYNNGGYSAYSNIASILAGAGNQPPTALMSATPSTGAAPLTVSFDGSRSTDPDGTVSSWAWSFGDGTSGTGPAATHVYSTPGTYTASLTVTDNSGASSTTTGSIVVNSLRPPPPFGLTATALTRSSIGLRWTNGSAGQTEVRIERCRGLGCTNFSQVAAVAGTATTFTDTGLTARTTYSYRLRAHGASGDSLYSNTASARTKR